ncbi:MAG: hypothetical protein ACI837_001957 [Crocinitomicaceae bacterium]
MKAIALIFFVLSLAQAFAQVDSVAISAPISIDTLISRLKMSVNPLSDLENPVEDATISDSMKKSWKKVNISGEIGLTSEYGLLTTYIDTTSSRPLSVASTNGDLSIGILGLPVNFSYYYSTFRNPLGVNNYVRFSLDVEKLKQQTLDRKSGLAKNLDSKIGEIGSAKEKLTGKLGLAEVIKQRLSKEIDAKKAELAAYQDQGASLVSNGTDQLDSAALAERVTGTDQADSLTSKYAKTKSELDRLTGLYDTLNTVYNRLYTTYEKYSNWQSQIDEKKNLLNGFSKDRMIDSLKGKGMSKGMSLLSSIKTFDLGLTYPSTTALSTNSVPIQGINIETQHKNWYTNVAAGVTMNNLMVTSDVVQNKLFNGANLFNQFDFQQIKEKQFMTLVKTGYGTPESSHIFIGGRYQNKANIQSWVDENPDSLQVPSMGLELDARWKPNFLKGSILDLVYGKTSRSKSLLDGTRSGPINSLFSNDHTNTGLIKWKQSLSKLRSEVTGSFRWIDTDADMASMGVLQSNNVRYEVRTNHAITSRIGVGFNYRADRNNVRNDSDTTLSLNVIGGQFNGKIGKKISYFGSVHYLTQTVVRNVSSEKSNNYMIGAGVSAQYEAFSLTNAATLAYNDYLISDSASTGLYRTVGIQNLTKLSNGSNKFSVSYFLSDDVDILNASTIIGDEYTLEKKKVKITGGLKVAISNSYGVDLGAKLEVNWIIKDWLHWSIKGEKLVLGDFYNYYDRNRFDRFPYVLMTNVNFIIK